MNDLQAESAVHSQVLIEGKMGQMNCSHCSEGDNDPFDASPYVDLPYLTREDVLQLKTAFDFLCPQHGIVSISKAKTRGSVPSFLRAVLTEAEKEGSEITFDDLYRLMKGKIVERKRNGREPLADLEGGSMNASCLLCPYALREETPRTSAS